ncbi:hypothetical protein BC629DRAFT_295665 [Irpex lacteus]|nr:hypothetical protein BC629DRAFT_295665 [Irpex lacteus]
MFCGIIPPTSYAPVPPSTAYYLNRTQMRGPTWPIIPPGPGILQGGYGAPYNLPTQYPLVNPPLSEVSAWAQPITMANPSLVVPPKVVALEVITKYHSPRNASCTYSPDHLSFYCSMRCSRGAAHTCIQTISQLTYIKLPPTFHWHHTQPGRNMSRR